MIADQSLHFRKQTDKKKNKYKKKRNYFISPWISTFTWTSPYLWCCTEYMRAVHYNQGIFSTKKNNLSNQINYQFSCIHSWTTHREKSMHINKVTSTVCKIFPVFQVQVIPTYCAESYKCKSCLCQWIQNWHDMTALCTRRWLQIATWVAGTWANTFLRTHCCL